MDLSFVPGCASGRIILVCQDNLASILTYREAFSQQPLIQQLCLEPLFSYRLFSGNPAAFRRLFSGECRMQLAD